MGGGADREVMASVGGWLVGWFIHISDPPFGIQGSLNPRHHTRNLARN